MVDTETAGLPKAAPPEQVEVLVESPEGMPRIKTVSLAYARKFNLGNYESLELEFRIWAEIVPEEDDLDLAVAAMWEYTTEQIRTKALPLLAKAKAPPQPADKRPRTRARPAAEKKETGPRTVPVEKVARFEQDGIAFFRVYGRGFLRAGLPVLTTAVAELKSLLTTLGVDPAKLELETQYNAADLHLMATLEMDDRGKPKRATKVTHKDEGGSNGKTQQDP